MKITKYILSFAAAAGLLAACQTPEIVQIASPENVVPASLHELEVNEIAISATNQQETVSFSWEAADYGAPTQINYSLEAALDETSQKVTILSGLSTTEATVTYEDLNRVLFNDLEVPEGQPTELKFYVGSVLYAGSQEHGLAPFLDTKAPKITRNYTKNLCRTLRDTAFTRPNIFPSKSSKKP